LYTTLYLAVTKGKDKDQAYILDCKKQTLARIKRMLAGMSSGV
jgi:hypothetical protein